jgi:hypothetical protein
MRYWLDLFTYETWEEFLKHGCRVSGFSEGRKAIASRIQPGDILLCYVTGIQRWVGALEVVGRSNNTDVIWRSGAYPIRYDVKSLIALPADRGIDMHKLVGKTSFYRSSVDKGKYAGLLRGSPSLLKVDEDGKYISKILLDASQNPVSVPINLRKIRSPIVKGYGQIRPSTPHAVQERVSIPLDDEAVATSVKAIQEETSLHTEVQAMLAHIGAEMGLNIWVARNDRGRVFNGTALGQMPRVINALPTQFNEATNRTIELIDILWLKGASIVAAFEIECTTSVYSGILRMSDLLALQPNLEIRLYLVAPPERRSKVQQEITRPTFTIRDKPIPSVCGFLPIDKLTNHVDQIRQLNLGRSLDPAFLATVAEYFT